MKPYKITDLQLEQFLLNEIPDELMREINSLINDDPVFRKRVEDLKKSTEEIIKMYPADLMAEKIKSAVAIEKQGSKKTGYIEKNKGIFKPFSNAFSRTSKRFIYSIAATATSAAVAAIIILGPSGVIDTGKVSTDNDIIRIKGMQPGISVYRKTTVGTEELKDAARAAQGDLLQIGYFSTGEYRYGVILSIDGRGSVTLHYPGTETGSAILKLNKKVMLDRAYELDDSPSYEKFILILSKNPPDIKNIIQKAKNLAQRSGDMLNGRIMTGENTLEFSMTVTK